MIRIGYTIYSPVTEGAEPYLSEDNDLSRDSLLKQKMKNAQ